MTIQYWIRKGTEVQGPFDQLQIRGLVAIGQLVPTMEISTDGTSWQSAGRVPGLFPIATQDAAPVVSTAPKTTAPAPPVAPSERSVAKKLMAALIPPLLLLGILVRYFHVYQAGGIGSVFLHAWPIIALS